ncbi:GntR family transcriptional regulator [Aquibium carbonis]|uniref:GntR family transcriptional regulator n=1 Tax=Aquibium carbonis TaxID=2495581 RepID=A0A429YWB1_9HYPH|nr:GntR family transcriptional regulator [Aquibium carbonis]RST85729.1 GntR family transcriptional regulator [Aquibium carbonis]
MADGRPDRPLSLAARRDGGQDRGSRGVLGPVVRDSLQERVYRELRGSLIHGVFDAGEILRIQDLADTLQTSTMPVREALARLVSEQALEALPSRSVRVPIINRERLDDLARARTLVEGELVRLAMGNLTATDFARIRDLTRACEAAFGGTAPDKAQATSELNHAFHFAIYGAAGSAVLLPIVESLWLQSGPYVRVAARVYQDNPEFSAVHHHWELIEALERGDEKAAAKALTDDITQSFNLIRGRLDEEARARKAANG